MPSEIKLGFGVWGLGFGVEKMLDKKSSDKVREKLTKKRNVLNSFRARDEL